MPPLDFLAAALTCTSTVLLARKRRAGFIFLVAGSLIWLAVSLISEFSGRAVWGQTVASGWTCLWSVYGWRTWRSPTG
jgi:hypothetical protein